MNTLQKKLLLNILEAIADKDKSVYMLLKSQRIFVGYGITNEDVIAAMKETFHVVDRNHYYEIEVPTL